LLRYIDMASLQLIRDIIRLGPNDECYYFKDAETSGPSLAGYLDFSNTKEMGRWLDSSAVRDVWLRYYELRMRGFGGLGTKATPISLREYMML